MWSPRTVVSVVTGGGSPASSLAPNRPALVRPFARPDQDLEVNDGVQPNERRSGFEGPGQTLRIPDTNYVRQPRIRRMLLRPRVGGNGERRHSNSNHRSHRASRSTRVGTDAICMPTVVDNAIFAWNLQGQRLCRFRVELASEAMNPRYLSPIWGFGIHGRWPIPTGSLVVMRGCRAATGWPALVRGCR